LEEVIMFEIDGLEGGEAGSSGKGALRVFISKKGLATLFLLFAVVALSSAQVEYEPGERKAERLFELGLSGPWIISEKHPEFYEQEETTWPSTSEFSRYSEYFSMTPFGGLEVERYYTSGVPQIYIGGPSGESLASSAYQPSYAGASGLWILGTRSWTGYAIVPQGAYLRLVAYAAGGGRADFYTITPTSRLVQRSYNLYPGYSLLTFRAEEVGRYVILFSAGERMSNAVIVDVRSGSWPVSPPGPEPSYGSAMVTLKSAFIKGFSVFVDGSYVGADGRGGDLFDGVFSTTVSGNQRHTIKVYGSGLTCTSDEFYESGHRYTIDVCST
jgi:hypothetical protein